MAFRPSTYSDIHEVYAMDNGGCSKKEAALKAAKAFASKQKILTKARKAADKKVHDAAKALHDCKKGKTSATKTKSVVASTKKKITPSTWTLPKTKMGTNKGTARSASLADIRAKKGTKSAHGPSEGADTSSGDAAESSTFTASASDSGFTASLASDEGSSADSSDNTSASAESAESAESGSAGWMMPALIVGGLAIIGGGAFMYYKSKKAIPGASSTRSLPALVATPTIHVPDEEPIG